MLKKLLTPRWIITTLLVIAAVAVMVRLGFWQLDRLAQRRAFNAAVMEQTNEPALLLDEALSTGTVAPDALDAMQYHKVILRGEYRPAEQVVVRNQVYEGQPGYHLLTPLYLTGTPYAVMVDRGWISMEDSTPDRWKAYDQPGTVEITGQLRKAQNNRVFGAPDPALAPGQARLDAWNAVNLARMKSQVAGELLPVYVEEIPLASAGAAVKPPVPQPDQPDLSEGSHFGYAMQWFAFAAILAGGYPFFVRSQLKEHKADQKAIRGPQRKGA